MKPKIMKELPPDQFPWSRYDGGTIPNGFYHRTEAAIKWLSDQNIIGFIPGFKLEVRPRDEYVGILIEDCGYTTWAHLPYHLFEAYQNAGKDLTK